MTKGKCKEELVHTIFQVILTTPCYSREWDFFIFLLNYCLVGIIMGFGVNKSVPPMSCVALGNLILVGLSNL